MGSIVNRVLLAVTAVSLIIAASCVAYFIVLGKGISIDKSSHSTSESNSYANSGSLSIGYIGGDYRGNWDIAEFDCEDEAKLYTLLRSLDPVQFVSAKVVHYITYSKSVRYSYKVYFPKIVSTAVEDHKVKRIINGVEVKQ